MCYQNISACGINCLECELYKLPKEKAVQDILIPFFRRKSWINENEGIEEIINKGLYCKGCNVDKSAFWSRGCQIAACCKETYKFENCSDCLEFPCEHFSEFSKRGKKYKEGYNLLISLR